MSEVNYAEMKMADLRKAFPEIKAVTKREFIEKIVIQKESEKENPLGNNQGVTGTVKATLSGKKVGIEKGKGKAKGLTKPPNVKEEKEKGGEKREIGVKPLPNPNIEAIQDGTVLPDDTKQDREQYLKHPLVKRYLLSREDLLSVVRIDSDESILVIVGDEKSKNFKCLHLRANRATKTVKAQRGLDYKYFKGSVG